MITKASKKAISGEYWTNDLSNRSKFAENLKTSDSMCLAQKKNLSLNKSV
jgi:hypothetical protein